MEKITKKKQTLLYTHYDIDKKVAELEEKHNLEVQEAFRQGQIALKEKLKKKGFTDEDLS